MQQGWHVGTLLGFPIRVDPSAIFLGAFLLISYYQAGGALLAGILLLAVLVAVLFHELGHALVIRLMGWESTIVLTGFGGVTLSRSQPTPRQQVGISVAGPAVNFALVALCIALLGVVTTGVPAHFLDLLLTVNLFLGIFNMLPVLPLDGGQAFRSILRLFLPRAATPIAAWVSVVVAAGIGVYALLQASLFMGLIALFLISTNWSDLGFSKE